MPSADGLIELYEGNNRTVVFTVYQFGTRIGYVIPTGATVNLEIERADPETEVLFTPISVPEGHPTADWANGVAAVDIGPPVTTAVGSYLYSLTLTDGSQIITLLTGRAEVKERPGFASP